jgi:hypothetical protein
MSGGRCGLWSELAARLQELARQEAAPRGRPGGSQLFVIAWSLFAGFLDRAARLFGFIDGVAPALLFDHLEEFHRSGFGQKEDAATIASLFVGNNQAEQQFAFLQPSHRISPQSEYLAKLGLARERKIDGSDVSVRMLVVATP